MALPLPVSLSPSKVSSFTDCALAFRFSAIDRLPEPPTVAATRGTLVHAALEALHCLAPADRTPEADGIRLRGIIDRLELDADGELVVTDYKTGAAPSMQYERKRLSGVHIYSLLCEQLLGRRPRRVQLLYLRSPVAIITEPSDRSTRGTRRTLDAVWQAVERACDREDFRPQPSRLCDWCSFQAYCPSFGGDPAAARELAERLAAERHAAAPTVAAGPVLEPTG